MKRYRADLHIHTALSPCADAEMTPPAIVRAARGLGLALIAVCDHNSAGNAAAVLEAAAASAGGSPGGDRRHGDHDAPRRCTCWAGSRTWRPRSGPGARCGPRCPPRGGRGAVRPRNCQRSPLRTWEQQPAGRPRGADRVEERLLAAASGFSLAECVELIRGHGGLAVAAHLDRRSFSVLSQLGFLPEEVRFDAVEISAAGAPRGRVAELAGPPGCACCRSSDGHDPGVDRARRSTGWRWPRPASTELALALRGEDGQEVRLA